MDSTTRRTKSFPVCLPTRRSHCSRPFTIIPIRTVRKLCVHVRCVANTMPDGASQFLARGHTSTMLRSFSNFVFSDRSQLAAFNFFFLGCCGGAANFKTSDNLALNEATSSGAICNKDKAQTEPNRTEPNRNRRATHVCCELFLAVGGAHQAHRFRVAKHWRFVALSFRFAARQNRVLSTRAPTTTTATTSKSPHQKRQITTATCQSTMRRHAYADARPLTLFKR